ncbi:MAG: CDP-glycerol glycerophosphotransferase family protein [Nitrospirae bacterium]|nr:CDP-glycerol glycerophosphotransferase family protein [Candidatus Troglogloeales bacterium]
MANRYLLFGSERYALAMLRPLQAAARERGCDVAWFFCGPDGQELRTDERLLTTVEEVRLWNPQAVLTPNNVAPDFFPGVKVEIFHGFNAGKPGERHFYIRGFFDLYCTTGPADTHAFSDLAAKLGYFSVRETGWPKLDPFFRAYDFTIPKPVRQPPTVLYHSTFSPSWSAAEILYETVKRLSRTGRWRWVVHLHSKSADETVARYRRLACNYLRFADNDNILDLFSEADVMVSDTSSAVQEFLLTYRPVVTFKNHTPGPQLIDIDDPRALESSIEFALSRPPELMQRVRDYADFIHPFRDGDSSERVLNAVDALIAAGGRHRTPKPFNLWRKLKIRRLLHYYRWS